MFEALATAIEGLDLSVDGAELTEALWLRDRFEAKVTMALAAFDAAELWDEDGSVSAAAWLRVHAGIVNRDAARLAHTARRMRALPVLSAGWVAGDITGGQAAAIMAITTERTADLLVQNEHHVAKALAGLDVTETVTYLRTWQARAEAHLDRDAPEPPEPAGSTLHLSPTLDGHGRLDANLSPEDHDVVRTALRLAESADVEGEPARTPAGRRADALVDVCRRFLDGQQHRSGGRHRPHLNVIVDLEDLVGNGSGRTLEGLPLSPAVLHQLACDAGIHRIITDGPSSILDYGRTTRTIPPAVYTSLVVRDWGCRFPGCDRPADWCEGHHIQPWELGGPTCLSNLVLLCSRHHHRIHLPGWHLKLLPTGTVEVTQPDGTVRTSGPPDRCRP